MDNTYERESESFLPVIHEIFNEANRQKMAPIFGDCETITIYEKYKPVIKELCKLNSNENIRITLLEFAGLITRLIKEEDAK